MKKSNVFRPTHLDMYIHMYIHNINMTRRIEFQMSVYVNFGKLIICQSDEVVIADKQNRTTATPTKHI